MNSSSNKNKEEGTLRQEELLEKAHAGVVPVEEVHIELQFLLLTAEGAQDLEEAPAQVQDL